MGAKRQRGQVPRDFVLSSGAASTRERERGRGRQRRAEEKGRGELISSTHAHGAALRVPRDSPGIPHNIPSSPLIPRRTHGACPPKPPGRPLYLLRSLRLVAAVPTGSTGLSSFPEGSQDQDRSMRLFYVDYFILCTLLL